MDAMLNDFRNNTQTIIDFLVGLDETTALKKARDDSWNAMECMEHVFVSEKGIHKLLNRPDLFSNQKPIEDEALEKFKDFKYKAPEFILPKGRFSSLKEMVSAFKVSRSELETWIANELHNSGEDTAPHPILGPLTKNQWIRFVINHSERHLNQMKASML